MLWRVCGVVVLAATSVAGRALGQEQHTHSRTDRLGEVSFPVSCLPTVQKPFERGVALLHSFAYAAAEKQFGEVLQPMFRQYPQHPGAAHDLIHAYDNPEMAKMGLLAARAYAQIAPSAPHALHMPSHIFTLLGLWRDSVESNRGARAAAHRDGDIGEELHAMDYLEYAHLQAGQYNEAKRLLNELEGMKAALPRGDFKVGYAAAAMPARYAVEQRKWADAAALVPLEGDLLQALAVTHWARAVGLARSRRTVGAAREIEELQECLEKLRGANDAYWATQVEIQIDEAKAWAAANTGRQDEALALARSAADREDALEKRPVTPGPIVPAREQFAELSLQAKKPEEALAEFEKALKNAPGRRGALTGGALAAELAGEQEKAKRLRQN